MHVAALRVTPGAVTSRRDSLGKRRADLACNAGPRCRHHHHAKQAAGWSLTQPLPGYHTWTTPAGRSYTTGPTTYPI